MLNVFRNLIGIIVAIAVAFLVTGGAQEAFRRLAPAASDHLILGVDIGTYIGFVLIGLSFLLVGLFVRRWIRSRVPLLWLILPVVGLWLWMHAGFWFLLTCSSQSVATCVLTYSLLLVPLSSGLVGYRVAPYFLSQGRSES
jgi:hypothetical protein